MPELSSDFGHWVPLKKLEAANIKKVHAAHGLSPDIEAWGNDVYEVIVHNYSPGQVHLSIKRYDRRPIRNWRHFQQMKNEICGLESEAVELFPAESRLVDNANQYHLWVMLEPPQDGELGELDATATGRKVTDLLIIPRDPERLTLAVGMPEGGVTDDSTVERFNNAPHPGRQEPWQEGLTTGRNELNVPTDPEDTEIGA